MAVCSFCASSSDGPECGGCGRLRTPAFDDGAEDGGLEGVVLADRFRLGALLGSGGMGRVYLAEQIGMQREVAVKVLRPSLLGDAANRRSLVARFQREVLAVARLEHPNTIRVYDQGATDAGLLFLVMERLRGRTLAELLDRECTLPAARVADIGAQVCRSLAEAHDRGVIHRDLKPDNVFLAEVHGGAEQVKVLDFGIAKVFDAPEGQAASALTRSDMVIGTAAYMSPEQATSGQVQPASDLYALGAILFQCLTGRVPYAGETPVAVMLQHAGAPAPRVPDRVGDREVPRELARLIHGMLEKDPDRRPGPTLEVAACLEAIARELRQAERAPARRRKPRLASPAWPVVAVGGLVLGLGAGFWVGPGSVAKPAAVSVTCDPPEAAPAAPVALEAPEPLVALGAPAIVPPDRAHDARQPAAAVREVAPRTPAARNVAPCRPQECPFTHPCRDSTGRTWKGEEFCFPTF